MDKYIMDKHSGLDDSSKLYEQDRTENKSFKEKWKDFSFREKLSYLKSYVLWKVLLAAAIIAGIVLLVRTMRNSKEVVFEADIVSGVFFSAEEAERVASELEKRWELGDDEEVLFNILLSDKKDTGIVKNFAGTLDASIGFMTPLLENTDALRRIDAALDEETLGLIPEENRVYAGGELIGIRLAGSRLEGMIAGNADFSSNPFSQGSRADLIIVFPSGSDFAAPGSRYFADLISYMFGA